MLLATTAVVAQQVFVDFSPLPWLPKPGEPLPEGQYVFGGPTVFEVTVLYPERDLDGRVIGIEKKVTIPLGNRVDPQVECEVTQRPDGQYLYRYTLTNGPNAKEHLKQWSLRLPWDQGEMKDSPRWNVSRLVRNVQRSDPRGPKLQISMGYTDMATWTLASPLGIGQTEGGFEIVSPFAPGPTKAYANSGAFQLPGDLPDEARKGIAEIDTPDEREHSFITIGPQYPAGFPKVGRAADFAYAFRSMSGRQLESDTDFVHSAVSLLDLFLQSGGEITIAGSQFDALDRMQNSKERQFGQALRMAFQAQ
jgi:hypothetical protein